MEPGRRTDELAAGPEQGADRPVRRRLLWAIVLVCGGVALGALRPDLALHAEHAPGPGPTATPSGGATGERLLSIVAWDIRGDLAGDRGFVSAAVSRIRQERPEIARVFFAGRLPDGGRIVLAGSDVYRGVVATAVHALVIEPGVALEDAPVTEVAALTDPQQVLGWAGRGRTGHVYAVVLTRPGPVKFELSPNVHFAGDGSPRRIWTPVYTEDGLVVADLGPDVDPVVTVRATGPGVFTSNERLRVMGRPGAPPPAALRIRGVTDPAYQGPDPDKLAYTLRQGVGAVADLSASRIRVLWSGAPWKQRRLALVLVTRSDGVRLQALVGQQGSSAFAAGVRALPKADPDVTPWLLQPFTPEDPTFLLCPTGAGTLVYHRPGQDDRRLAVHASGAVLIVDPGPDAPSASGAGVTLLDPKGRQLLTTILPEPGFDDPLAFDLG